MRAAAALLAAALLAGCGGGDGTEPLTVFAAASLADVLEPLAADARFNFAGSDELATQIREGAEADVYAAANEEYPAELHAEGLVAAPRVFATNSLVVIVPAGNPAGIQALGDLARDGVKLVLAAGTVPAGRYAREALARVGAAGALDRVVSEEEDVKGVVAKVALGEADAGVVYSTDARAAGDDVEAIPIPAGAEVPVRYAAAVVSSTGHAEEARAFLDLLLGERGRAALRAAGFGVP